MRSCPKTETPFRQSNSKSGANLKSIGQLDVMLLTKHLSEFPRVCLISLFLCIFMAGYAIAEPPLGTEDVHEKNTSSVSDHKGFNSITKSELKMENDQSYNFDLGSLVNLFGILVGVWLILWQMKRQHRSSLALQRENLRAELKLQIYKELAGKISDASQKTIDVVTMVRLIIPNFISYFQEFSHVTSPSPVPDREPRIRNAHFEALSSISQLISKLEEYEIVNPNLPIFRTAFRAAHHDIEKAFWPLHDILLQYLPHDVPKDRQIQLGTDVILSKVPDQQGLDKIRRASERYDEAISDASCYLYDLAREAQNALLGGLFDHTIPPRKPIDPRHVVITTSPNDIDRLKKYFKEETALGRENQRIESEVRESLKDDIDST